MQCFASRLLVLALVVAPLASCRSAPRTEVSIDPERGRLASRAAAEVVTAAGAAESATAAAEPAPARVGLQR